MAHNMNYPQHRAASIEEGSFRDAYVSPISHPVSGNSNSRLRNSEFGKRILTNEIPSIWKMASIFAEADRAARRYSS